MCCRYWIGPDMVEQIQELLQNIAYPTGKCITRKDIRPSETAPVIHEENGRFRISETRWGFPSFGKNSLIINARAESVLDKKLFYNGIHYHRAAIPALGFYEWSQNKEKNLFYRGDSSVIYMAGIMDCLAQETRFVILTTQANESMRYVHDRMPLVLENHQVEDWIHNERATQQLLKHTPVILERQAEFEQMRLF